MSRVLNEDGLIEPFLRHHAALVSHHVLLDNGSTDATEAIVRSLHAEGMALSLLRSGATAFAEVVQNTRLYREATALGADWIVFLDCDEFLDARGSGAGTGPGALAAALAAVPADVPGVRIAMLNYHAPPPDSARFVNPVQRLILRDPTEIGVGKVALRRHRDVTVDAGNHGFTLDGVYRAGMAQDAIRIAHYPDRSPHQMALKAVVGRLKVVAAGQDELNRGRSTHYAPILDAVLANLPGWLRYATDQLALRAGLPGLVNDPLPYLGGPLRHTPPPGDEAARFTALLLNFAARLAASHGSLLRSHEARRIALDGAMEVQRVL